MQTITAIDYNNYADSIAMRLTFEDGTEKIVALGNEEIERSYPKFSIMGSDAQFKLVLTVALEHGCVASFPEVDDSLAGEAKQAFRRAGSTNRRSSMRHRRAVYEEGELVESIELLRPQDLLTEDGRVRDPGKLIDRYDGGPGRPFGDVYEVLKLADRASPEEFAEAEEAMRYFNKRLEAHQVATDEYYDKEGYGETWQRFGLVETRDGIYIAVDIGGYDI